MIVLTAEQAAEVDRRTIHDVGIPGLVLMETAGRLTARVVAERWPDRLARGVVVVAGPGNNGGDGMVAARALHARGVEVKVFLVGDVARLSADAAHQWAVLGRTATAVERIEVRDAVELAALNAALASTGVCIDALFGIGLGRAISGTAADAVAAMNAAPAPVASLDIPSGVNGTSGHILGCAVQADVTICAGALKRGVLIHPGAGCAGDLVVAEIGFPAALIEAVSDGVSLTTPAQVREWMPQRPLTAHKGSAGRLVIAAGARGMGGAAVLVTRAALRAGAGLVTLCLPQGLGLLPQGLPAEALTRSVPDDDSGAFGPASEEALREAVEGCHALAVGPGAGRRAETLEALARLLERVSMPAVVDADGLRAMPCLSKGGGPRVLTPHAGEMATLMEMSIDAVLADPIGVARACASRFDAVALLKGPRTVVAASDGRVCINASGNPGLASGGMGDTLTGIIGAWLAQGVPPFEAAAGGAFVHGRAADLLESRFGQRGMLASEVADALPNTLRELWEQPSAAALVSGVA